MHVQPYLDFNGRCEEAIEFSRQKLGAEVLMMTRFGETPEPHLSMITPGTEKKIMHSSLRFGTTIVMASDGYCTGKPAFQGISLALSASNDAEAERLFGALSDGGQVRVPLDKTFFSSRFGMVADRFGVTWMVIVAQ